MLKGQQIDRVRIEEISAEQLWSDYVSQRKPVLIDGQLKDAEWKAAERWTDEYILQQAGDAQMMVEWRDSPSDPFGGGRKVRMSVKDFIKHLQKNDEYYYLTSNMQPADEDGHPQLYQTPLTELRSDICLRPQIMGNLIPQQLNLWWGAAKHGSSTGLHHDFHDNLYVLLRGKKRFTMFPPCMAENMYTNGEIKKIYGNGRIVYADQEFVNADGSVPSENKREAQLADVERRIQQYELEVENGVQGAQKKLQEAEEELDILLDEELQLNNDFVESKETIDKRSGSQVEVDENDPPSFSQVDINASPEAIKQAFEKFPSLSQASVCEVHAGQMLYLPAGWFHEVKSFNFPDQESSKKGHMAFNFWFHPPDNLSSDNDGFKQPYLSNYWTIVWQKRCHLYQTQSQSDKNQDLKKGHKSGSKKFQKSYNLKKNRLKLQKIMKKSQNQQQNLTIGVRRRWSLGNFKVKKLRKQLKNLSQV